MTKLHHEILFIDANVSDAESLIDGLSSDIEVVLLDDKTNVLNQIATFLDSYQNLDAIHIISHGLFRGYQNVLEGAKECQVQ